MCIKSTNKEVRIAQNMVYCLKHYTKRKWNVVEHCICKGTYATQNRTPKDISFFFIYTPCFALHGEPIGTEALYTFVSLETKVVHLFCTMRASLHLRFPAVHRLFCITYYILISSVLKERKCYYMVTMLSNISLFLCTYICMCKAKVRTQYSILFVFPLWACKTRRLGKNKVGCFAYFFVSSVLKDKTVNTQKLEKRKLLQNICVLCIFLSFRMFDVHLQYK